jgi:hypothetical protein
MNASLSSPFIKELAAELRSYHSLCEEILNLTRREHQGLSGQTAYEPEEFLQKRRTLLPDIELLLAKLRSRRMVWQQAPKSERERCAEVTPLFQTIQDQLMKVLLLDRENQQIMLRRGMVPASHLPAPSPKPNYVARVYQRNFTAGA